MKTALLATMISFSAFASDCYVRKVELVTNEVKMAREICFTGVDVKLDVFGKSMAVINYSIDGVAAKKEVKLSNPIELRNGKVLFPVYSIQSDYVGGYCSDMTEASVDLDIIMNKEATEVILENVRGTVTFTNDNCHSSGSELQNIVFEKK